MMTRELRFRDLWICKGDGSFGFARINLFLVMLGICHYDVIMSYVSEWISDFGNANG